MSESEMMLHNNSTYILLALIAFVSFVVATIMPVADLTKAMLALPGVGALFSAVFQIARDEARFEKDKELAQIQSTFSLGISSHMANVVFDKHVAFCDEYMAAVDQMVAELWKSGPSASALNHAANLQAIQRKHSAWLTPEMGKSLEAFEQMIRTLGADAGFARSTSGVAEYEVQRHGAIERMYDAFKGLLGIDRNSDRADVEELKEVIRGILGVKQLTLLRQKLIRDAIQEKAD